MAGTRLLGATAVSEPLGIVALGVTVDGFPSLREDIDQKLAPCEVTWATARGPEKFALFNDLWQAHGSAQEHIDYVLFLDDDVRLPEDFLPTYMAYVQALDFALAQPARSIHSTFSHTITVQRHYAARRTRFVEAGPVFSLRRDALKLLMPFDLSCSKMCGGREFNWTAVLEKAGLKMGIVDAVPVDHNFRPDGFTYDRDVTNAQVKEFLRTHEHVDPQEAMRVLEFWS